MKHFILSLLFLFQFNLFSQQAASNNMQVVNTPSIYRDNSTIMVERAMGQMGVIKFDDIKYEYLLDPATQIIKSGYIKREGLKGIISVSYTHLTLPTILLV